MAGQGNGRNDALDDVRRSRVIGIIRARSAEAARADAEALVAAGADVVEVSLVTPGALDVIAQLAELPLVTVGVGTVMNQREVRDARAAGSAFVVSPTLSAEVIGLTRDLGMASFPGAATPTEMVAAVTAGASAVKVFPASVYGPGGIANVLASLPSLQLVPTGGVAVSEMSDYIRRGAVAVGIGAGLVAAARADAPGLMQTLRSLRETNPI